MFWFWFLVIVGLILWAAFALHPAVGLLVLIGIGFFFWAGAKERGWLR
jgi:hypothetical protein